jgi:oxygen-dependent protoporphyrinogen oxidase
MMVPTQLSAIIDSPLFSDQAGLAYRREPQRAEELKSSALPEGDDESVASFVRRHFGDEVARTVAAPLLSGVFGGDIETLSVRAVMPAFVQMERERGSLITALQSRPHQPQTSVFTTLRSGLGTLIDRITAALPAAAIRLSESVLTVTRVQQGWRLRLMDTEEIFDAVIVATPAHATRRLLRPLNEEFFNLLAIDSTSAIVIALAFTPEQARTLNIPPGFGYLIPQSPGPSHDAQLLACTFVHQKFPHRIPQGAVLLRAFFGGETAANLLKENDEALAALALERLSEILGPLPAPHLTVVRRWPWSLPQYAVGHPARIKRLEALVASYPGLHLIGNAYHGVGLPDMVRMGREAASFSEH